MKKIKLSILLILVLIFTINAQNTRNLVVKMNTGERFIAFVNQRQINNQPLSKVVIAGLVDNYYNVKIQTITNNILENNLYVAPNSEIVYVFYKKMNYLNQNFDIEAIYPSQNSQNSNSFAWYPSNNTNNGNVINGMGQINININNQVNTQQNVHVENELPIKETIVYLEGYDGEIGCEVPVNSKRFDSMLATIESKSFDSSKKRIAKQIISSNCIFTDGVVKILKLFDFENDKLEMAKFAYDYTYDIENYYKINNVFDFESTIKELDEFIQGN